MIGGEKKPKKGRCHIDINKASFDFNFCWGEHRHRKLYPSQCQLSGSSQTEHTCCPGPRLCLTRSSFCLTTHPLQPPLSWFLHHFACFSVPMKQNRTVWHFCTSGSIMSVRASILWHAVIDRPLSVWAGIPLCKYTTVYLSIVQLIDSFQCVLSQRASCTRFLHWLQCAGARISNLRECGIELKPHRLFRVPIALSSCPSADRCRPY